MNVEDEMFGVIVNGETIPIRANPSDYSEVVYLAHKEEIVMVAIDESTDKWFSVCSAGGMSGYCPRCNISLVN